MLTSTTIVGVGYCCFGSVLLTLSVLLLAVLLSGVAQLHTRYCFAMADRECDHHDALRWVAAHEGAYLLPLHLRVQLAARVLSGAEAASRRAPRRSSAPAILGVLVAMLLPAITTTAAGAPDRTASIEHHRASAQQQVSRTVSRDTESPRAPTAPAQPSPQKQYAITGALARRRKGALARGPGRPRGTQTGSQGTSSHPAGSYCGAWWRSHGALTSQANEFARLWGLHLAVPAAPALAPDRLRWTLSAIYELLRDAVAPAGREACLGAAVAHLNTLAWAAGPASATATRLTELAQLVRARLHEPRLGGDCDAALIAVAKLRLAWG